MRWVGAPGLASRSPAGWARGFTLVELIMVIVLVGVLSVVAVPRLIDKSDVSARGFHDSTLAYLRYAQKTAIAQRRTVCLDFGGVKTSLTLKIANTSADSANSNICTVNLAGPGGENPALLQAPSSFTGTPLAQYTAVPTNFNFDGQGQPVSSAGSTGTLLSSAQALQVVALDKTGTATMPVVNSISVEPVTGYVHE